MRGSDTVKQNEGCWKFRTYMMRMRSPRACWKGSADTGARETTPDPRFRGGKRYGVHGKKGGRAGQGSKAVQSLSDLQEGMAGTWGYSKERTNSLEKRTNHNSNSCQIEAPSS